MKLSVVGCGDAFGSGDRLQTCFHVALPENQFLIDCGATVTLGMGRLKLNPDQVGTIFISHLHGDHFGGLVWWLLQAHFVTQRTLPLTLVGPVGLEARLMKALEALYPGALPKKLRFNLTFRDLADEVPLTVGNVTVIPFEVSHPCGAPPYALRFEAGGKVLAFSGDTEWVENLIPASAGADLFITECQGFMRPIRFHLTWDTLSRNLPRLTARRILLTHMGDEMSAHRDAVDDPRVTIAEDGLEVNLGSAPHYPPKRNSTLRSSWKSSS